MLGVLSFLVAVGGSGVGLKTGAPPKTGAPLPLDVGGEGTVAGISGGRGAYRGVLGETPRAAPTSRFGPQ